MLYVLLLLYFVDDNVLVTAIALSWRTSLVWSLDCVPITMGIQWYVYMDMCCMNNFLYVLFFYFLDLCIKHLMIHTYIIEIYFIHMIYTCRCRLTMICMP